MKMRFSRRACAPALVISIFFAGCAGAPVKASAAGPSETELINAYRHAHDSRDLQAMMKLYCWDRVTPEIRKMTEQHAKEMFDEKIGKITITSEHPKERLTQYIRNGVTYGLNVTPVRELVVETPVANSPPGTTDYPVGIKDGHYCIAVAAPVPNGALTPEFPAVPPAKASAPAAGLVKGQRVVVPAQTAVTVRLQQMVGAGLLATGGGFTAVLSEPVRVNGAIVIPLGARVRGVVTKEGKYSPEMALTSVLVDGKSRPVSTVSVSFNEQVSFPPGSEATFHLRRALTLEP
jgi:hypothetical protein